MTAGWNADVLHMPSPLWPPGVKDRRIKEINTHESLHFVADWEIYANEKIKRNDE